MTVPTLSQRAAEATGTEQVRAVGNGARHLIERRAAAEAAYPAMDAMRDRAREIRLHTLANLDTYLARFADAFEALGGHVHFAADAAEATDHVLRIADRSGARTMVKSKSMVTEEIELNDALEADGRTVVETDLGELIVQLAGDRPSHIIAPVMHWTKEQVGELFADKLDVDYSDEPTVLNQHARTYLRRKFLEADMGISGVNFAAADTGTITLVTNEGNGRLSTTAPRVHVAVMGMERIAPTLPDVGVLLEVLARSGTGQSLSTYTNMITGPRRAGDDDGPDELHVVIVDNGRSRVLADEVSEVLACIRCGACLNVCPVYRTIGGHAYGSVYQGPVGSVLSPVLFGMEGREEMPYACTLCGACLEVCPPRIDLPGKLLHLRQRIVAEGEVFPWLDTPLRAYAYAATHPGAWRTAVSGASVAGRTGRSGWFGGLPWRGKAWTAQRDMPAPAKESFRAWWRKQHGT